MLLLAEAERDRALAEGYWWLSLILLVGGLTVLLFVGMFLLRRWARRQVDTIESEKQQRREAGAGERIDAWRASSDRYVDHDRLPDDVPYDSASDDDPDGFDEEGPSDGSEPSDDPPDDENDPYGLFKGMPYRDPDEDEDDDEEWDEDDEDDKDDRL